ncbi:hypothetical protein Q5O24_14640 [Eubacteriaceae bacterium ES3]|nr:hypothetical protein Q5O24_14640 [Eubacteriaceae bacterium ES3]
MKNNRYLYLIVLGYFLLGFVNIHFALFGLVCMSLPIILLFKNTQKTWCQGYCPRAGLLNTIGKSKLGRSKPSPKFFTRGSMKWIMLIYFGISLTFITISTIRVATAGVAPMEILKLLIVIPLPFEVPQLVEFSGIAPWLTHLSYRFYSMMLTTTLIGLSLSVVYKPRTWCTVCPISTVSGEYIKFQNQRQKNQAFE